MNGSTVCKVMHLFVSQTLVGQGLCSLHAIACYLRNALLALQKEGRKARQKRQKAALSAEMLGQAPVKQVPRTIENTREDDVTFVKAGDEDIAIEEEQDEFAAHFNNERPPHVLLTTCYKCTGIMYKFCADMMVRSQ